MHILSPSVKIHTIGNATSIFEENGQPILATDPWLHSSSAYFGSWSLTHQIPQSYIDLLQRTPFIWISHFHPDHLSLRSLLSIGAKSKTILLAPQYRNRVAFDLRRIGFNVIELPSKKWITLSSEISIATYPVLSTVDSVLLVKSKGQLVVNLNDTESTPGSSFLKQAVAASRDSLLLKLAGYGDADMINIYQDGSTFVEPCAAAKPAPGRILSSQAKKLKISSAMHFSSFHQYTRTDSSWANKYTTPESDLTRGWLPEVRFFPHHSTLEFTDNHFVLLSEINPSKHQPPLRDPSAFCDKWSASPTRSQADQLSSYLKKVNRLIGIQSFLSFRVGDQLITDDHPPCSYTHTLASSISPIVLHSPLHSLLLAVRQNVFDDLLISNFPRLYIFRGGINYSRSLMYPAKYLDNLYIETASDLKAFSTAHRASYDSMSSYYASRISRRLRGSVLSVLSGHPTLLSRLKIFYQRF